MGLFTQVCLIITLFCVSCFGRIHKLDITNDGRKYIALSTFGFYQGGILDVRLKNFRATPENDSATVSNQRNLKTQSLNVDVVWL
jgi:hypothetical protein